MEHHDPEQQQIADAIQEDKSRGRRGPAALAAQRERSRLIRLFRKHLERGTEQEFRAAIGPPILAVTISRAWIFFSR
jgi:hypothetical protein